MTTAFGLQEEVEAKSNMKMDESIDMEMAKQIEYDDVLSGYFETVQFETQMLKKIDRFVKDTINE